MNLKPWEEKVWNGRNLWQKARIAYRHDAMDNLTEDELRELVATLSEMNFIANMSDDWKVTVKETRENNAIAAKAKELLN